MGKKCQILYPTGFSVNIGLRKEVLEKVMVLLLLAVEKMLESRINWFDERMWGRLARAMVRRIEQMEDSLIV